MICVNKQCSEAKKQNGTVCRSWTDCPLFLADLHRRQTPKTPPKTPTQTEAEEQATVVEWCGISGIPVLHIPNEGKRSAWTGAELKRMGMQKGVPDLFIPVMRGGFGGLFIEMKRNDKTARVSKEQRQWLIDLGKQGYDTALCFGADEAIKKIKNYMEMKKNENQ